MTRLEVCQGCDQFVPADGDGGRPACRQIRCCSAPELPSPIEFARRIGSHHGRCPHKEGDMWSGAESPPAIADNATHEQRRIASARTKHGLPLSALQERVRCCVGHGSGRAACAAHVPPLSCAAVHCLNGDIRESIMRPDFACPLEMFGAVEK